MARVVGEIKKGAMHQSRSPDLLGPSSRVDRRSLWYTTLPLGLLTSYSLGSLSSAWSHLLLCFLNLLQLYYNTSFHNISSVE